MLCPFLRMLNLYISGLPSFAYSAPLKRDMTNLLPRHLFWLNFHTSRPFDFIHKKANCEENPNGVPFWFYPKIAIFEENHRGTSFWFDPKIAIFEWIFFNNLLFFGWIQKVAFFWFSSKIAIFWKNQKGTPFYFLYYWLFFG